MHSSPASLAELQARSQALAGLTLGQIAAQLQLQVPANLQKDKGWVGQLLEQSLGLKAQWMFGDGVSWKQEHYFSVHF